jgi:hypothetical protein
MGEARKEALRVGFDSRIQLEFHGDAVTSDGMIESERERDPDMVHPSHSGD